MNLLEKNIHVSFTIPQKNSFPNFKLICWGFIADSTDLLPSLTSWGAKKPIKKPTPTWAVRQGRHEWHELWQILQGPDFSSFL